MHRCVRATTLLAGALLSACAAATTPITNVPPANHAPAELRSPDDARALTAMVPAAPPLSAASITSTPLNGTVIYNNTVDGSLHALDLATTTDVVLADPSEPHNVLPWAVAPDGHTVAVIWGKGWGPKNVGAWTAQLWLVNIDGTTPRKLLDLRTLAQNDPSDHAGGDFRIAVTHPAFQVSTLAWTPDGTTILTTSSHENQPDLYAIAANGSGARRLTNTPDVEFDMHVSPDGQHVAYASVETFGTGAGWGNAAAWVQPLAGSERQSLIGPIAMHPPSDPNGIAKPMFPTSIAVLGWTNNSGVLTHSGDNGVGTSTFWLTTPGNAPRAVVQTGLLPRAGYVWNQAQGTLVFANARGTKADYAGTLQRWTAQHDQTQDLGALSSYSSLYGSPDGTTLLACNDNMGTPTPIHLWRNGTEHALAAAPCQQRAWAADGRFALSGNAPRNDGNPNNPQPTASHIFAADGTLQRDLLVGAVVVGWQHDALLFWAPQHDGRWQLLQAVGNTDTPISNPIAGAPWTPTLLPAP